MYFLYRKSGYLRYGLLLLLLLLSTQSLAEEQNVNPGINRHYQNPDYTQWQQTFERPGREVYDRRHDIVTVAAIKPGMIVADVGAGTGLFTRLFSPVVGPAGKVYAVDISQEFVINIERNAKDLGMLNIIGIVNKPDDAGLPNGTVDVVFTCDTYHHFEYPQTMLASIHRALKPEGKLIIIDFIKQSGKSSQWVLQHVRADKKTVIKEVEATGFKFIKEETFLKTNYYLHFLKK